MVRCVCVVGRRNQSLASGNVRPAKSGVLREGYLNNVRGTGYADEPAGGKTGTRTPQGSEEIIQ